MKEEKITQIVSPDENHVPLYKPTQIKNDHIPIITNNDNTWFMSVLFLLLVSLIANNC